MGPVWENEDELGYWAGGGTLGEPPASSTAICNAILSKDDQGAILLAAFCAHEGHGLAAERVRREANYDNLGFRPDADCDPV